MMNAKIYKKTKVMETPLATVQIESEYYEQKPAVMAGEGPPRWVTKIDPSKQHPDAKKQTDQRNHMNVLFQLGREHRSDSGEEKSAGSDSCDQTNGDSAGAHRSASSRHLDGSASDLRKDAPEPEKDAAETYLGISLRDISNKLFMTSINGTHNKDLAGGVEETKEGDEDGNNRDSSLPSMAAFDIGKVLPMHLLDSMPAMPFIGSKASDPEDELNDPANGKAPLFTEEMQEQQRKSLVPLDEIRIINPCDACNANLLTIDDSGCYLRPAQSDDMSCVTIPNMNETS